MLRPQYTRRPFELMLIGEPYSGKRTISKQLLKCRDVFFSINVSNSLPKKNIKRTDYILFIVDMTNKSSLEQLSEALSTIEARYLLNKFVVVVTKVDIPERWAFKKEDVNDMLYSYAGLDAFYVNLEDASDRKAIVEQIVHLIKIETLQYQNVDVDFIKAQEFILSPYEGLSMPTTEEGSNITVEPNGPSSSNVEPMEVEDRGSNNVAEQA